MDVFGFYLYNSSKVILGKEPEDFNAWELKDAVK